MSITNGRVRPNDYPLFLRPYIHHGIRLSISGDEGIGDCPFCGRERKFTVNVDTGLWRCLVCNVGDDDSPSSPTKTNKGGNAYTFLRVLHRDSYERDSRDIENGRDDEIRDFATNRGVKISTLRKWGICRSLVTGEFIVPGYGVEGKIIQLYRYAHIEGRNTLVVTAGLSHTLMGLSPDLYTSRKLDLYVCEGLWDAMALWEVMRFSTPKFQTTTDPNKCILAAANVIAVPGCGFSEKWVTSGIFRDKTVRIFPDNDYPRRRCLLCMKSFPTQHPIRHIPCPHCGSNAIDEKIVPSAGYTNLGHIIGTLHRSKPEHKPEKVEYLVWGDPADDMGFNPDLPNGYDMRDALKDISRSAQVAKLEKIFTKIVEWSEKDIKEVDGEDEYTNANSARKLSVSRQISNSANQVLPLLPCEDWKTLVNQWRKAMYWWDGLDRTLSFMLSVAMSVEQREDMLWGMVVSVPSSGKTELCEALATCRKYVHMEDTVKSFFSGWQTEGDAKNDHSLIAKIKNKCFIWKEADVLLKLPNRQQIMSELRTIYDKNVRTSYRNASSRSYEGWNVGCLICGTDSLREMDNSESGARYLNCELANKASPELDRMVARRKMANLRSNIATKSNGVVEDRESPEKTKAKQLTGGYLKYLRENSERLLNEVEMSDECDDLIYYLSRFVAHMRARPSKVQDESVSVEMSPRLVSQLGKLAFCTAVVLNRKTVDDAVMRRVIRVAADSSQGKTLEIVKVLHKAGLHGMEDGTIAIMTKQQERLREVINYLGFLRRINVIETRILPNTRRLFYVLTDDIMDLYDRVGPLIEKVTKPVPDPRS